MQMIGEAKNIQITGTIYNVVFYLERIASKKRD
jgi:hypothetical protein